MKNILKAIKKTYNRHLTSVIFHLSSRRGFSLIEVILAAAVFITFATAATVALVSGYNANRLGAEFTIANQFAAEGIEATKSIKNQAYANLVNTSATGVDRNGTTGVWQFGGTNDTFTVGKNYTRTIKVESVNRDGTPPNGNIVAVGGTTDADTKKVTSTVTWNFNSARPETISLVTYLTDWRKAIATFGDALLAYGDTASVAQPKFRTYTDSTNTFSAEASTGNSFTDTLVGKNFFVQTSPTKTEAVVGYVNNSGVLRILCYDGSNWSSEWTVTVGGNGTNDGRYGIAFEKTTGDAMVVYSTNTATSNEMAYRTKAGSSGCGSANWAAATNITAARTNGIVHWIRVENSPVAGSNNIALAWADAASDLSAMIWTGSSWAIAEPASALETELERVSASQDVLSFDIAYETTSGELMVVWGLNQATTCTAGTTIATTNCIRYATYTSSWSAAAVVPTVADPATNIDISANPNSNELVFASTDNSQADMSIAYWSGSAWTGRANVDTTTAAVAAGNKIVATGWLINGATTRYVVAYNDSATTNIGWYVGNGSGAPALQTDFTPTPVFGNPQRWYRIDTDPKNKDRLMFTLSDNGSDLFAKRLVMTATPAFTWSNSDGGAALDPTIGQTTSRPFGFGYWRNP
jgi:hypothetical protein